jgi:phosphoribosylanthranilate isomerase
VGVFRDERPDRVVEIVNTIGLKAAQLHGREALSEVRYVRQRVPAVIQAFAADDPALAAAANSAADMVLVDSPTPGSGRPFDWSLVEAVTGGMRVVVAGGLTPENVGGVIRRSRPFGVDVATGVETPPGSGRKDPRKVRRFVDEARAAGRRQTETSPHAGNGEPVYDWAREEAR